MESKRDVFILVIVQETTHQVGDVALRQRKDVGDIYMPGIAGEPFHLLFRKGYFRQDALCVFEKDAAVFRK